MINNEFKSFGRKSDNPNFNRPNNAVPYTRVSTSEQTENYSLENQLEKCLVCAERLGLKVVERFGGTHESAKTDDRAEFNRMLKFISDKKNKVGYIIVSDIDRFSRSGTSGIAVKDELEIKYGVLTIEADAKSTNETIHEKTMKNLKLILAHSENQLRREKCVEGSIKRLKDGLWCGKPPKGYIKKDKNTLIFSEEAKNIKTAFLLKRDGYTNAAIMRVLKSRNSTITKTRLPKYLSDPFYCGIIANKHLNGEVVNGKHEPIIDKEIFLEVNNIKSKKVQGYKTIKFDENRPLQGDLKCSCGGIYTGYLKKSKYHYYKCNKCHQNTSIKPVHDLFEELLGSYSFEMKYLNLVKKQLKNTFDYINNENINERIELKKKITQEQNSLSTIDMNFALGKIPQIIYNNTSSIVKEKIESLEEQLLNIKYNLSNYEDYVEGTFKIINDIKGLWKNGEYSMKKDLQNILFSNHIEFDPIKNSYRTPYQNQVITLLTVVSENKKAGKINKKTDFSRSVLKAGIEPALQGTGF